MGLRKPITHHKDTIMETIVQEAKICGAIIKEGSLISGTTVEWLGTEISTRISSAQPQYTHGYRLKASFVRKFGTLATSMLQPPRKSFPIRSWYALISSSIFATWTKQIDLCTISPLTMWMAVLCGEVSKPKDWDKEVVCPEVVQEMLTALAKKISTNRWTSLPKWIQDLPITTVGVGRVSRSPGLGLPLAQIHAVVYLPKSPPA